MHEVRALSPDDDLVPLVDAYVRELWENGGDIPHTEEAVRAIVTAVSSCVCLVAGSPVVAWTAAGECPMPWPTTHGKTAMSIGTYVAPEHRRAGVAKRLRVALQEKLADFGFDTLLGGVHVENDSGRKSLVEDVGFKPYQILGYRRLS